MAFVQMKCPNCGGTMGVTNTQFLCPNCRTMILNITDAKIDADVTVISPEEFAKKIEETKRQFVINIDNELKVFDVDAIIYNKKIKDATEQLACGFYERVASTLTDVPDTILSAERLRYLADFRVKSEYELSSYDGCIDVQKNKYGSIQPNQHYNNILKLADEQTKTTYIKLTEYCKQQFEIRQQIRKEASSALKLIDVNLYDEALIYANKVCQTYPQSAISWAVLIQVKFAVHKKYDYQRELSMMQNCVDFTPNLIPQCLFEKLSASEVAKIYLDPHLENYARYLYMLIKDDIASQGNVKGKISGKISVGDYIHLCPRGSKGYGGMKIKDSGIRANKKKFSHLYGGDYDDSWDVWNIDGYWVDLDRGCEIYSVTSWSRRDKLSKILADLCTNDGIEISVASKTSGYFGIMFIKYIRR